MVIGEPSATDAGAAKVAVGATLSTVTEAAYSALSPPSSSRTWPLTFRAPLSLVGQAWPALVPYAVQVVPLSQLKRYWCVSAVPGSTTAESETLIGEPSATDAGAVKVAVGATLSTVTAAA